VDMVNLLEELGELGVVHGDIKLGNIGFHGGRIVVYDFGTAVHVGAQLSGGTLRYMHSALHKAFEKIPFQFTASAGVDIFLCLGVFVLLHLGALHVLAVLQDETIPYTERYMKLASMLRAKGVSDSLVCLVETAYNLVLSQLTLPFFEEHNFVHPVPRHYLFPPNGRLAATGATAPNDSASALNNSTTAPNNSATAPNNSTIAPNESIATDTSALANVAGTATTCADDVQTDASVLDTNAPPPSPFIAIDVTADAEAARAIQRQSVRVSQIMEDEELQRKGRDRQ